MQYPKLLFPRLWKNIYKGLSTIKTSAPPEEPKKSDPLKTLSRLLITIIAFFLLVKYGNVDVRVAIKHLMNLNINYFIFAYLSYLSTMFIAGSRFYFVSSVLGFKKKYLQCVQLNFVGTLFNNFLPTTFGGDALRGYYLKKGTHVSLTKAAACILFERYAGLVVLFWISSVVFLLQDAGMISNTTWEVPKEFAWLSYIGTMVSFFIVPFIPKISNLFGKENWIYKKFIEPVIVYWHDYKLAVRVFLLSLILQCFVILCHYFIALSLGIDIPLSYYLIFYPLTTIAGFMIPSLNGLGVREGTYIYFLGKIGINNDQGLAFGIGWLVILLITSIIGGLVYFIGDFRKNHH